MEISREEIKNIASLARIGINEKESEKYHEDFSSILGYVRKLDEIDTGNIEPIGHITGRENISAPDRAENPGEIEREDILANAPELKDGHVKVRLVF